MKFNLEVKEICGPSGFDCGFGLCIPQSMKCDGVAQCPNLSDEQNCCQSGHFCNGNCLPTWKICNGIIDCPDGSDEQSCSKLYTLFRLSKWSKLFHNIPVNFKMFSKFRSIPKYSRKFQIMPVDSKIFPANSKVFIRF